jgi:hypothetical protein
MERVYPTPSTRCDPEADYRQAGTEFEHRLGKKMQGDAAVRCHLPSGLWLYE